MKHRTLTWPLMVFVILVSQLVCAQSEPQSQSGKPATEKPAEEPKKSEAATTPPKQGTAELWRLDVDAGYSGYGLRGELPGKFKEHRDVPRGAVLRALDLTRNSPDSPVWGELMSREVGETDQRFMLGAGRVGRSHTSVLFDKLPHFFSKSPTLFQNTSPGFLQVSPDIRRQFQSLVDGQDPTVLTSALFDTVRSQLAVAPLVNVATRRDRAVVRETFRFTKEFEVHAEATRLRNRGVVPMGFGTFARFNVLTPPTDVPCGARTAATACDGQWEALGVEVPAPVDTTTTGVNAGTQWSSAKWSLGADYDYSRFHPAFSAITYENPFRISDAQAVPPGSSNGRNRMVLQQSAVPPTNINNAVTLRGALELPLGTQFTALVSKGRLTQDDDFLPYTLNSALAVQRVGGSANLPANFDPTNPAFLPQRSLNGRINTLNQTYALVARPRKHMTLRLRFRGENQQNRTPEIIFPGMSRFGESDWVTSNDYFGNSLGNLPRSFERKDYGAEWRWEALRTLSVGAEYDHETWHRTFRDVTRTTGNSVRVRTDYRPAPPVTVSSSVLYGRRSPDQYKTLPFVFNPTTNAWEIVRNADNSPDYHFERGVALEPSFLRRYDETNLKRKEATGAVNVQAGEKTNISASARYGRNDYNADLYGLNYERGASFGTDVSYTPTEQSHVFIGVSSDASRMQMRGIGHQILGAVNDGTACCPVYPLANTWIRNGRDTLNSITTGGNLATKDEKTLLDVSYAFSSFKERIHTFNPSPVPANAVRSATAYDYPDSSNKVHEVLLTLTRSLRRGMQAGVRYRYDSYNIDDFYLNDMSTYPEGVITRGGVAALIPRQIFLNARYGNHAANQAYVFVRYQFDRLR